MPDGIHAFTQWFQPVTHSIGLEMTDSHIKMVEVTIKRNGRAWIRECHMEPLPERAIDDGRIIDPLAVTRTLQTLVARFTSRTKSVHMVLPSQDMMVRFLKFPDVPLKDLGKLIEFELKHSIHLPFDRPVYDFIKWNGTQQKSSFVRKRSSKRKHKEQEDDAFSQAAAGKEDGFSFSGLDLATEGKPDFETQELENKRESDVMLVAAPQEQVEQFIRIVKDAGLRIKSIEIKALALYRVIETTRLADPLGTYLVLDINPKASDLSIFHEGQIKITRSVPLVFSRGAAEKVTEAVAGPDAMFSDFADPDAVFNHACSDLAHELERLVNFYKYTLNNRNQVFEKIVLAGDVPRLKEIAGLLSERLSLEVVPFYSDQIQIQGQVRDFNESFPAYAVPIGLALRGGQT